MVLKAWPYPEVTTPGVGDGAAQGWVDRNTVIYNWQDRVRYRMYPTQPGQQKWSFNPKLWYSQETIKSGDTVTGTTAATAFASSFSVARNYSNSGLEWATWSGASLMAGGVFTTSGTGNNVTITVTYGTDTVFSSGLFAPGDNITNGAWALQVAMVPQNDIGAGRHVSHLTVTGAAMAGSAFEENTSYTAVTNDQIANAFQIRVAPSATSQSWTLRSFAANQYPSAGATH